MLFRTRRAAAGLLAFACGTIEATGQTYSIDAHIVSAGTSARSGSACFRMTATIAEPVAGFSSSTNYSLMAGFRAVAPNANDDIFFSGFEACP
jgi:hypothetical protein